MKKIFLALSLLLINPINVYADNLILNQSNPHHGDNVTFTSTYPKEATQEKRKPQFHFNPQLQVICSLSDGTLVLNTIQAMASEINNRDGTITGTSYPVLLDNQNWPVGSGADCQATLGYWRQDVKTGNVYYTPLGDTTFIVLP